MNYEEYFTAYQLLIKERNVYEHALMVFKVETDDDPKNPVVAGLQDSIAHIELMICDIEWSLTYGKENDDIVESVLSSLKK